MEVLTEREYRKDLKSKFYRLEQAYHDLDTISMSLYNVPIKNVFKVSPELASFIATRKKLTIVLKISELFLTLKAYKIPKGVNFNDVLFLSEYISEYSIDGKYRTEESDSIYNFVIKRGLKLNIKTIDHSYRSYTDTSVFSLLGSGSHEIIFISFQWYNSLDEALHMAHALNSEPQYLTIYRMMWKARPSEDYVLQDKSRDYGLLMLILKSFEDYYGEEVMTKVLAQVEEEKYDVDIPKLDILLRNHEQVAETPILWIVESESC